MRLLLAGASGAIGRRLIPRLLSRGHYVVGITRSTSGASVIRSLGGHPVIANVLDPLELERALDVGMLDAVVCQLTDLPQELNLRRLADAYAANNRVRGEGTANVLDAAQRRGAKRAVVQSMASWYAPGAPGRMTEDAPLYLKAPEPVGAAVRVLHAMESDARARALEMVVLRYGVFYGPGTWYARDGSLWVEAHERRLPILIPGDGKYSFVHVEDAAEVTVAAVERAPSGVLNVVDDEPAPASDWIPAYAEAIGAPPPRRVPRLMARMVGGGFVEWEATIPAVSNAAVKRTLGWEPRVPSWRTGFRMLDEASV